MRFVSKDWCNAFSNAIDRVYCTTQGTVDNRGWYFTEWFFCHSWIEVNKIFSCYY